MSTPLEWDGFVDAAQRSGWTTYIGTADDRGHPHVAVVAPGFTPGTLWFATWASSRKCRNLRVNPEVAFHWPLNNEAPGELAAWGRATVHDSLEDRRRLWDAGVLAYDPAGFFRSPDEPMVFVEVSLRRARLLTAGHEAHVWEA